MSIHIVTVFGGTGFLGRRVVRHLRKHEFSVRIASRHPDRSRKLFGSDGPCLQSVEVDILDERMVADVLAGAYAAVNAVSLYVERGQETFHSVHVDAAERVAVQAHRVGVERLAHGSGLRGRWRPAIPLHPQARGRRGGGEGPLPRRKPLSSGCSSFREGGPPKWVEEGGVLRGWP